MTRIESEKHTIQSSPEAIFNFLRDMNNIRELLPEDKISDWQSDSEQCSFKVQGAYKIGLVFDSAVPPSFIKLKASDNSPFPFDLNVHLDEGNGATTGYMICNAEINAFLKMMVEKPLQNLFNYMAQKLEDKFSSKE